MADRGNVTKRGTTTNFISLSGQTTNGLPLSTGGDSFFPTGNDYQSASADTFTTTIVYNFVPMPPDVQDDGYSVPLSSQYLYTGATDPTTLITPGGGGTTVTTYYKMQGYYVVGAVYETWIAVNAPNNTPPSGHTLINIAIIAIYSR